MADSGRSHWGSLILGSLIILLLILIRKGYLDQWADYLPFRNPEMYFYPLVVLLFTVIVAKFISQVLHEYFETASGNLRIVDRTRYALFSHLSTALIYIVGIGVAVYLFDPLRNLSVSLFAGAGVLAIIFGLATQRTLGNLVSGTMIAVYQPYRIGDRIKVGEEYGSVVDINLRQTEINTWDNRRIIIPNSKMDDEVINNYTIHDPKILGYIDVGISYDSDIDLAREIMRSEALKHPEFLDLRVQSNYLGKEEPVRVRVISLDQFQVMLRLYFWAQDQPAFFRMKCDLLESIKKRFDAEGVEIPYPYRTIVEKRRLPKPARLGKKHKKA